MVKKILKSKFWISLLVMCILSYTISKWYATNYFTFDNIRYLDEYMAINPAAYSEEDIGYVNNEVIIKEKTTVIYEDYDVDTGVITEKVIDNKVIFLGMRFEDVLSYISKYPADFGEEGYEISSVMLVSFAQNKVVIRRNYVKITETQSEIPTEDDYEYRYYITEKDGFLVILKEDNSTIFLVTQISVELLDEEELERIKNGIGVKDIYDLYGYLESLTS